MHSCTLSNPPVFMMCATKKAFGGLQDTEDVELQFLLCANLLLFVRALVCSDFPFVSRVAAAVMTTSHNQWK